MVIRGITDIGQVRASNQDSFYIAPDETWCVVADGMGGHNGGETASSTTVQAVTAVMEQGGEYPAVMEQAIREANQKVYAMSLEDSSLSGMGTTIVLCCFQKDSTAMIAHVGDSRAYHVSGDTITQIGEDFAYFGQYVPSCFVKLGGALRPLHTADFDADEEAIFVGAELMAEFALDFLHN